MRLIRFYIGKYRVLNNLIVDFNRPTHTEYKTQDRYSLDFLAGVNGTGKSTILHLIGRLFAQLLTENYYFPIPVTLTYALDGRADQQIIVSNVEEDIENPADGGVLRYKVGDQEWQTAKLPSDLLPRQIVIYTTGSETAWLEELSSTDSDATTVAGVISEADEAEAYLRELPGHRINVVDDENVNIDFDNPLLFIRSERLPLVALCGLIASLKQQKEEEQKRQNSSTKIVEKLHDVLTSIGLDRLSAFSLKIRSQRSLTQRTQQEVIDDLTAIADHKVQQGSDMLLVFNISEQLEKYEAEPNRSIFGLYESPIALFQRLNYLYENRPYYDPPLQEVSLFFKRLDRSTENSAYVGDPMLQLYDWLSDGEQSFLGRMALFALFRAPNMLIMLDEPEVHFNDVWKREIVNMLDQIMSGQVSHAVITTHSSIALTDVRREDILVLHRREQLEDNQPAITEPSINTLGADPSDILVHVFGSHSASGERSVKFIREQIGRSDSVDELNKLKEIVAPGYWRYRIQLEAQRLTS